MGGYESLHGRSFDGDQMATPIGQSFGEEEVVFMRGTLDPAIRAQMEEAVAAGDDFDKLVKFFGEANASAFYSSPYAEDIL